MNRKRFLVFARLFGFSIFVFSLMGADWPFYKSDNSRSSSTNATLTTPLQLKWTTSTGVSSPAEVRYSSPIVAGDRVFVGSNDGRVMAFDLSPSTATNPPLWIYKTDGPIYGSPAYAIINGQGRLYIGSTDGNLYCFNPFNGSVVWKKALGGTVFSSPLVVDQGTMPVIYTGCNDNKLHALKAENGDEYWSQPFRTGGYVFSSPVYDSTTGYVFISSYDGYLYAVNSTTGIEVWRQTVGPTRTTPALVPGRIVNLNNSGVIQVFNPADGTVRGNLSTYGSIGAASSPAMIATGANRAKAVFAFSNGLVGVWDLVAQNGILQSWQRILTGGIYSSPAIANNAVYIGCDNGNLYVLNQTNGNILQTISLGASVKISPAIGQNTLLISSGTGELRAYGMAASSYQWSGPVTVPAGVSTPYTITAVDASGNIIPTYSGSANLSMLGVGTVTFSPSSPVTFDAGKAVVNVKYGFFGTKVLHAQVVNGITPSGIYTVQVVPQTGPQLQVITTCDKSTAKEREDISYVTTVRNTGISNAAAVQCVLPMPKSASFVNSVLPVSLLSPTEVYWSLGDISTGAAVTITYTLAADPATIFASDFSVGELSDAWETTNPKLYTIDQDRMLVTSPLYNNELNWLHTKNNIYNKKLSITGTVQFLGHNQSVLILSRSKSESDYLRFQTDVDAEVIDFRLFGGTRQTASMPKTGLYRYLIELDFVTHHLHVLFYNAANSSSPLIDFTTDDPTDTPDMDSLYFGVFNNIGALWMNDDLVILNPDRIGLDQVIVEPSAQTTMNPIVSAVSNAVTTNIRGNPRMYIEKTMSPPLTNPRLAVESFAPITYVLRYRNDGNDTATNVSVWDTLSTALGYEGVGLPPGVVRTNSNTYFHNFQIGNLLPGASAAISLYVRPIFPYAVPPENVIFSDGFDYSDKAGLFTVWQSNTPDNFNLDGHSGISATGLPGSYEYIVMKNPAYIGDGIARVSARIRWSDYGQSQFTVGAVPSGDVAFDTAYGAGALVDLVTSGSGLRVVTYDNTNGPVYSDVVGNFTPNIEYLLEVVFNRTSREATLRLLDTITGADMITPNPYLATNLGTYSEVLVGFRSYDTTMTVGNVKITGADIDQSASVKSDEFTRKFTTAPHLYSWVEKPSLVLSKFGPSQSALDENYTYTLLVENNGTRTLDAGHYVLTDDLASGLSYQGSNPPATSVIGNRVSWTMPAVPAFSKVTYELMVSGTASGSVTNKSVITGIDNPTTIISSPWITQIGTVDLIAPKRVFVPQAINTPTPSITATQSLTPTIIGTSTYVFIPKVSWTKTPTETLTPTATPTRTFTPSLTNTVTITPTATNTPTITLSTTSTSIPTVLPQKPCVETICRSSGTETLMYFNTNIATPSTDAYGRDWRDTSYISTYGWGPAVEVTSKPASWISPCNLETTSSNWIAAYADASPPTLADAYFRDVFTLPLGAKGLSATLVLSGDNIVEVWLNGASIGRFEGPYGSDSLLYTRCVTVAMDPALVQPGQNTLSFRLINEKSKHGLVYSACIHYQMACSYTPTPTATNTATPTASFTRSATYTPVPYVVSQNSPIPTQTSTFTPSRLFVVEESTFKPIAYPNPSSGQPVYFQVGGGPYDDVSLCLKTISGRTIWEISKPVLSREDEIFSWDLLDKKEKPVSNGIYMAFFEANKAGLKTTSIVKVVVLR